MLLRGIAMFVGTMALVVLGAWFLLSLPGMDATIPGIAVLGWALMALVAFCVWRSVIR